MIAIPPSSLRPHIRFPTDCRAIIDVTQPPYSLDNTGRSDCTVQLKRLVDDVLQPDVDAFARTQRKLEALPNGTALNFETRKDPEGVIHLNFAEDLPEARIIYFPNGTYLVSDTISYSNENLVACPNKPGFLLAIELNRCLHFLGESRDGVVIRLRDSCPGFGFGDRKPVVSFMRGVQSNVAMCNTFENLTVDVGKDNPGAVGLVFMANNSGAVRNVTIRSSDDALRGYAGIEILHDFISGCYVKHVEIVGFDYGVRVTPVRNYATFEHITLRHQKHIGFQVLNTITSIRGLISENRVPAVHVAGPTAHVVLVDANLQGGSTAFDAVQCDMGTFFGRNIATTGYRRAVCYAKEHYDVGPVVAEFCSHPVHTAFAEQSQRSLNLPIEEPPEVPWESDLSQWQSVNACGARGDGVTDDTAAIQAAMNSGAPVIWFQPGHYCVDGPITVPASVRHIHGMFCDFIAGDRLRALHDGGLFTLAEDSTDPLLIEAIFTWEKFHGYMRFIHHACVRPLILRDVHTQTAAGYFNSVPGSSVYLEDVACTVGGREFKVVPGFHCTGQRVWARNLNPERSHRMVINDGGTFWLLGFKSEGPGTVFETLNGGSTEVLGGTFSMGHSQDNPAISNHESSVSVVASTNGYAPNQIFPITVRETRNGIVQELRHDAFPIRLVRQYVIPLYVGRPLAKDQNP